MEARAHFEILIKKLIPGMIIISFYFPERNLYSDGTFQNVQKNQNIYEIECKNLLPDKIKQFQKT